MVTEVRRFLANESGATAIDGLIAAGISVAIITIVKGLGTGLIPVHVDFDADSNSSDIGRLSWRPF